MRYEPTKSARGRWALRCAAGLTAIIAGCGGGTEAGGGTDNTSTNTVAIASAGAASASVAAASTTEVAGAGTGTTANMPTTTITAPTTVATVTPAATNAPAPAKVPARPPIRVAESYTPLSWADTQPSTQYMLADGTLVTRIGGRTRDRHAREMPNPAAPATSDPYTHFAAHYFERRTHEITIYENVSPKNPASRILTLVVRPQWWLYGTNFRAGFIGRRTGDQVGPSAVALYGDNGGMKLLPAGSLPVGTELATPLANYASLPTDPQSNYPVDLNVPPGNGEFVLVKQLTRSAALNRELQVGDLIEFELGIFLAGDKSDPNLGRFNYYSDALVYQVGKQGVVPWFRGPCCNNGAIPWDSKAIPDVALSGGGMTLQEDTSNNPEALLLQAGTNMAGINIQPFVAGRRLFHTSFLTGAHTEPGNQVFTTQAGKAGPKFQQAACIQCHVNNGKSSPVLGQPLNTMVVLTGDNDAAGNLVVDTRFGGHLTQGLITENKVVFDGRQAILTIDSFASTAGTYPDQTPYTLQTPRYKLTDVTGKVTLPLPARMSVRTAPHLAGMGLLEAVPESSLEALATASLNDPDGAVGRLQIVTDLADPTIRRVGRFGWRGTSASVQQQTAGALNNDMGVTTTLLPTHGCGLAASGSDCRAADAKGPELNDADLALLVRYTSLLAVPAQRHFAGEQPLGIYGPTIVSQTPEQNAAQEQAEAATQVRVAQGGVLFGQARCTACHTATLTTGSGHLFSELRAQTIHPYSDLLLHDMGADLSDNFPQAGASGQEWRTAPLWGIGLLGNINPNVRFLHDGRARSIEEAVLWHGGQGAKSRDRFKAMSADDRKKLLEFVNSL